MRRMTAGGQAGSQMCTCRRPPACFVSRRLVLQMCGTLHQAAKQVQATSTGICLPCALHIPSHMLQVQPEHDVTGLCLGSGWTADEQCVAGSVKQDV